MQKYKRFLISFMVLLLSIQICCAKEPFTLLLDLPFYFPKECPMAGNNVARSKTHAFFNKWSESILSKNDSIKIKLLDKKYKGYGFIVNNEFAYDPQISFVGNYNTVNCILYPGIVNKNAYFKLKSPMLYDPKNNICVAVMGWRDYSKIDSSFTEPKNFEEIIYVSGPLYQTKNNPLILQELVLIPNSIKDRKKEQKYLKDIAMLYNKTFNGAIGTNSVMKNVDTTVENIILLPFDILLDVLVKE